MRGKKDQPYQEIITFTAFLTIVGSICLIPITWGWAGEWSTFLERWLAMDGPFEFLSFARSYQLYLQSNELETVFLAYVVFPTVVLLIASAYISIKILYVDGEFDHATHISGPRLLSGGKAISDARLNLDKELSHDKRGAGVHLHPNIQITKRRELGNVFVFGQQGSGKSVVIKPLLKRIIDRGDHAIIYDEKREYTTLFLDANTCLISPTDERSSVWNPSLDVVNGEGARLLAECFINGKDEFWIEGARLIVTGSIIYLYKLGKPWGWSHLLAVLKKPEKELIGLFEKHYPPASKIVVEGSKTTQGFSIMIMTQMAWLVSLAKAWPNSHKSSFSIGLWMAGETDYKAVIIPNDPIYKSISAPLCSAFVALSTQHLLALRDSDERRFWFVLDELGNLPENKSILSLLTLGRSKGSRIIAGVQSISQLHKIYGREDAETMLSLFSNIICLRLGAAGESAKKASEIFGERRIQLPVDSKDDKGNGSTTYSETKENVVSIDQITQCPQPDGKTVKGFLLVSGWNSVYELSWPVMNIQQIAKDYVPAIWLQNRKKPEPNSKSKSSRRGSRGRGASC